MIKSGCFKDIDICMMVHPCPYDMLKPHFLASQIVNIVYKGYAAHAAAFPWKGVNALDAAVMAYNNTSVLRQQIKPTWRIHGIITEGGVKANIIPDCTKLEYMIRAPTDKELDVLKEKVTSCFEAAASATGMSSKTTIGFIPIQFFCSKYCHFKGVGGRHNDFIVNNQDCRDLAIWFQALVQSQYVVSLGKTLHFYPACFHEYNAVQMNCQGILTSLGP